MALYVFVYEFGANRIYLATPNKFNKTHPVIIKITETIPTVLRFSPNNNAEIMADTTIPTALYVAYAAPKLILFSAFENRKKHRKYVAKQPMVGKSFVKPTEYFSNVVAINSSTIAPPSNTYAIICSPLDSPTVLFRFSE